MIEAEFANAPLADKRLARRLTVIATKAAADPAASFPQIARSDAELEGIYRFLNNSRVMPAGIIEPHYVATLGRMRDRRRVAVVHDSTQFVFAGEVADCLGHLPGSGHRGILGHFALAVDQDSVPLGVVAFEALCPPPPRRRKPGNKYRSYSRTADDRLAARWGRVVREVRDRVQEQVRLVHVMDREADSYELMNDIVLAGEAFVIRLRHRDRLARAVSDPQGWRPVEAVASAAEFMCERDVPIARRRRTKDSIYHRRYPERDSRRATLRVEALPVLFKRPGLKRAWQNFPAELYVNIVRVWEPDPPRGEDAVEWLLITNEPIATSEQVEAVIDWYRRRWKIEEYFKALKTGCSFERRQFQSRSALVNTLALLAPVAWQLLAIRDRSRAVPDAPARTVLTDQQLVVLRGLSKRPLEDAPTIEQALLAIAAQGGHLKRNGPPGWQTLGRGLEKLWWAEAGYELGRAEALRRT